MSELAVSAPPAVPPRLAGVAPAGHERDLLQYFYLCGIWTLTTYSACDLRCSYCVSYAQGRSEPRRPTGEVVARLRQELEAIPSDAVIGVGSLIDCYPRAEAEAGVTRLAIEELVAQGRRLVIVTKGLDIRRDIDLLAHRDHVSVLVSLPSLDDAALARIEPGVASATERVALIQDLAAAGVDVEMHVQPWIPGVTDAEAMIDLMGGRVPICFGPLNVQIPTMAHTPLARHLSQAEINRAYVAEQHRLGQRPGVVWQQPPWLGAGPEGRSPTPTPARDGPEAHEAAVRRLVQAFDDATLATIVLEVLSPHVVGHDATGLLSDPDHPESGQFVDVVGLCAASLGGVRFSLESVQGRGDRVDATVAITGHLDRSILGWPATAEPVRLEVDTTYRFDGNGLIVEIWQHRLRRGDQEWPPRR